MAECMLPGDSRGTWGMVRRVGLGIGVGVWGHLALEAVEELAAGQVVEDHVQLAWDGVRARVRDSARTKVLGLGLGLGSRGACQR
eukprot:scaffold101500_cov54-Phaeocystis_antarctica.AAC.1